MLGFYLPFVAHMKATHASKLYAKLFDVYTCIDFVFNHFLIVIWD